MSRARLWRKRRIAAGELTRGTDYWDYATRLELAVLAADQPRAADALGHALASVREPWEPETTARNLRLIREARERRDAPLPWAEMMEAANLIGHTQGIFACPEGGAVLAACRRLMADGWIAPDDTVVLFNTGSGHKYEHLWA